MGNIVRVLLGETSSRPFGLDERTAKDFGALPSRSFVTQMEENPPAHQEALVNHRRDRTLQAFDEQIFLQ